MPSNNHQSPEHYDALDAVRGIAILGVVMVHTSQLFQPYGDVVDRWLAAGARGVQLFFVASALTLMHSWRSRNDGVVNFYIRRLFRIAPLFWLAIAFYWALSGFQTPLDLVVASALFINGFHPEWLWLGPVPGGWSIATEMAFYLIFPALAFIVTSWQRAAIFFAFAVVFDILTKPLIVSLWQNALPEALWARVHDTAWLGLPAELPVFAAGLFLYFAIARFKINALAANILGWTGLALCLALPLIFGRVSEWSVPFGLLVFSLAKGGVGFLNNPLFQSLGKTSFAIYLVHFVVLWHLAAPVVSSISAQQWALMPTFVATVTISHFVAKGLQRLVETPGQRVGKLLVSWRMARKKRLSFKQT